MWVLTQAINHTNVMFAHNLMHTIQAYITTRKLVRTNRNHKENFANLNIFFNFIVMVWPHAVNHKRYWNINNIVKTCFPYLFLYLNCWGRSSSTDLCDSFRILISVRMWRHGVTTRFLSPHLLVSYVMCTIFVRNTIH